MTKWEYIHSVKDGSNILTKLGEQGYEAWYMDKKEIWFKRPIEDAELTPKPSRVVINDQGEAVSYDRAKAKGLTPAIIFVRNDGWSLGAPAPLMEVAESLWKDKWIIVIVNDHIYTYHQFKTEL